MNHLFLNAPPNFDFKRTVMSHGWCELLPYEFDQVNWTLSTVVVCKRPIFVEISETPKGLTIGCDGKIDLTEKNELLLKIGHMFRFDEDLREFYEITSSEVHLAWVAKQNAGRLLRSQTVYEDLVKTICTTNCSWSLTKIMVSNLVNKLGENSGVGKKAFPTAAAMAKMPIDFYKDEIRAGYRSAYLKELAEKVDAGILDIENWVKADTPTNELKKDIKKIKGVGDYAAETLLKMLGRYDGLALDSWLRGQFYKKYNDGEECDDKTINQHYEKFGKWGGLVIWCDMTEKWL